MSLPPEKTCVAAKFGERVGELHLKFRGRPPYLLNITVKIPGVGVLHSEK